MSFKGQRNLSRTLQIHDLQLIEGSENIIHGIQAYTKKTKKACTKKDIFVKKAAEQYLSKVTKT